MSKEMKEARLTSSSSTNQRWGSDINRLQSSKEWLEDNGLTRSKLHLDQILPAVGFKHSDDYIKALKKPVSAKYSNGLFPKFMYQDGTIYNIVATKDKLHDVESQLKKAILKYKKRLEWLTSGSRRIFGVVEEQSICIVLDVQANSQTQFEMYLLSLVQVIKEQMYNRMKLNIIRCGEEQMLWKDKAVLMNLETCQSALNWLLAQETKCPHNVTSSLETLQIAAKDNTIDAIYLYTENEASANSKQLMLKKVTDLPVPLHVVSINCDNSATISYLKELSLAGNGRFHEFSMFDTTIHENAQSLTNELSVSSMKRDERVVTDDAMAIWYEIDEARRTLTEVQNMMKNLENMKKVSDPKDDKQSDVDNVAARPIKVKSETYMGSNQWMKTHSLKAKKLEFFDFLRSLSFQHCEEDSKTVSSRKRYCDSFPHIRLLDGSVRHVHLNGLEHESYAEKINSIIDSYQRRLTWLQQGSRELFGTIIENKITFLIDTSFSMDNRLFLVKEKLSRLFTEQLCHKTKFNIVQFNTKVQAWQDHLTECNETNLRNAKYWVQGLCSSGSTNTLGALREALDDPEVEALYLLSDGRPDQPPSAILAHVNYSRSIPIHTISFNCADSKANDFLYQLATETGGRYHYFSEDGYDPEGPQSYESQDLRIIRLEMEKAVDSLSKVKELRDECVRLDWEYRDKIVRRKTESKNSSKPSSVGKTLSLQKRSKPPKQLRMKTSSSYSSSNVVKPNFKTTEILTSENIVKVENLSMQSKVKIPEESRESPQKDSSSSTEEKISTRKKKTRSNNSTKSWLSSHGLAAKKLRLVDVLEPTMVPHTSKYVPILDKYISSKVFNEMLPVAHLVKYDADNNGMTLVNPQALNIERYQKNIHEAIGIFEGKLNSLVLGGLSTDELLRYENGSSPSYFENRESMLEDLELNGWPVKKADIELLENEIEFARESIEEARKLIEKANEAIAEKKEQKRKISEKNLSQKQFVKDKATSPKPVSGKGSLRRYRNHRVVARSEFDGCYYSGILKKSYNPNYVEVLVDNGELQRVSVRHVIITSGSQPCPVLKVADFVLMKSPPFMNIGNSASLPREDQICYVPGVVEYTPLRQKSTIKCYTVARFDGKKLTCLRSEMIKISQSRYIFTIERIIGAVKSLTRGTDEQTDQTKIETEIAIQTSLPVDDNSSPKSMASSSSSTSSQTADSRQSNKTHSHSENSSQSDSSESDRRSSYDSKSSRSTSRSRSPSPSRSIKDPKDDLITIFQSQMKDIIEQQAILSQHIKQLSLTKENEHENVEELLRRLQEEHKEEVKNQLQLYFDKLTTEKQPHSTPEIYSDDNEAVENKVRSDTSRPLTADDSERTPSAATRDDDDNATVVPALLLQHSSGDVSEGIGSYREDIHPRNRSASSSPRELEETTVQSPVPDVKVFVGSTSNAVMLTKGPQGLLISRAPPEADPAIKERITQSDLIVGQEVLARSFEDGWYYPGRVSDFATDSHVIVTDHFDVVETYAKADVIPTDDTSYAAIKDGDNVIGLYSANEDVYAPGIVLLASASEFIRVRFFDSIEVLLARSDAYLITSEQYHNTCAYIIARNDALIGQAVVARDDKTGYFQLGSVRSAAEDSRRYIIDWADQTTSTQDYRFIFGSHCRKGKPMLDDKVIALRNADEYLYLPATIKDSTGDSFIAEFIDGTSFEIDPLQTYRIDESFYKEISHYIHNKDYAN